MEEGSIARSALLLSVQRALLGAIGQDVLGIYVVLEGGKHVRMRVFARGVLPDEQREALEVAATMIWADFGPSASVEVEFIENVQQLPESGNGGTWVYAHFGR